MQIHRYQFLPRYLQRFDQASFTFRFLSIAKESLDHFSLRIDTVLEGDHEPSLDNKTLIPRRSSCLRHRNKLRFIPREFPRNILFATPLEQPATLFTWLDNCALSTPGLYPRHAISNRPSECKWREVKCGVIDHPAREWEFLRWRIVINSVVGYAGFNRERYRVEGVNLLLHDSVIYVVIGIKR